MALNPAACAASLIRSSSVAMITSSTVEACFARSAAWSTNGLPAIGNSIFPGKRVDEYRAGMIA